MPQPGIPLANCADELLGRLAAATGSDSVAKLNGATLLGERAMLRGLRIPGRTSAGGGCGLFEAIDDTVALNLARAADRELLPALFQTDDIDPADDAAIQSQMAQQHAAPLVDRGRTLGLAIAAEHESPPSGSACVELARGTPVVTRARAAPRVLDLSALWAGPLTAHLLWLAGADVVKVESLTRPDAMRTGEKEFYALLNQGKSSVALDFREPADRQTLRLLIAGSDIVIEAARPRALVQLGIDAQEIVSHTPGLVWMTLTGHGAVGEAANWVGFGDDCAVSAGLSAALRVVTGHSGFVGDAIADPLTGIAAAEVAWDRWKSGHGGRFGLSMSGVVRECLTKARAQDPTALDESLRAWSAAIGQRFPTVERRRIGSIPAFGENTQSCIRELYSQAG